MSESIASSSAQAPENELDYEGLLASVRERFRIATASPEDKVRLFATQTPDLFELFLDALPPSLRQQYTCHACKKFLQRYGGVVLVGPDGKTAPVMWDAASTPEPYTATIRALAAVVAQAPIAGVFLSSAPTWGVPVTGEWHHLAVTPAAPLVFKPSLLLTTSQVVAEKQQDYEMLLRGLEEFPLDLVKNAHSLLTTGSLFRSEKCIGVAKWLFDLHKQRKAAKNLRAKENLTWLAVASAPTGFCHVRSSMIGTLLEDLAAGLPFADVKAKFDAKMSPLQYQRPTATPTAGNLAQAEKIVAKLKAEGSLERRFAKLADIKALWRPTPSRSEPKKGVFSHLGAAAKPSSAAIEGPPVTMTWDKFSRTVLPTAASIEYLVPASNQSYVAMVTAKNADAPPIVQWDFEDERNPVTWYVYHNGSTPARWNLKAGAYHPVTAVTLAPSMWSAKRRFDHQGDKVAFLLENARDTEYTSSAGFFPEFLKSDFHAIRATMEAYAKSAVIEGKAEAEACGICLAKGGTWNLTFRVTSKDGARISCLLDRWD
jgi:hypothetical protein